MRVRPPPQDADLEAVAERSRYVGSPYHKDRPGFAGPPQRRRTAASICPPELNDDQERVQAWLRQAILSGHTGEWRGGFPQRVWHREDNVIFEAMQGSPGSGEYHGYPLQPFQHVRDLP